MEAFDYDAYRFKIDLTRGGFLFLFCFLLFFFSPQISKCQDDTVLIAGQLYYLHVVVGIIDGKTQV